MPLAEVIHGEGGDDRIPEVSLARVNEVYFGRADVLPSVGAGEIRIQEIREVAGVNAGRLVFQRAQIRFDRQPE